jgi:hypothetical protein
LAGRCHCFIFGQGTTVEETSLPIDLGSRVVIHRSRFFDVKPLPPAL